MSKILRLFRVPEGGFFKKDGSVLVKRGNNGVDPETGESVFIGSANRVEYLPDEGKRRARAERQQKEATEEFLQDNE